MNNIEEKTTNEFLRQKCSIQFEIPIIQMMVAKVEVEQFKIIRCICSFVPFQMYLNIIFTTAILSAVSSIPAASNNSIDTAHKDLHQWIEVEVLPNPELKYAPYYNVSFEPKILPNLCFENYVAKLECAIASLSRNSNDIHAWNVITLYGRSANRKFIGDVSKYLNRCETSYGGKVKIFLKSLNKHLNDFSRPLPHTHFGTRNLCEDLCVMQAVRGIVLPNFNLAKYAKQFETTQAELLNVANDPILLNVISEMCEKMLNVQINCSFERYKNISEETERILVEFLLQTSTDVKHYLKYNAERASVVLPTGYIENPYRDRNQVYVGDSLCFDFSLNFPNGSI